MRQRIAATVMMLGLAVVGCDEGVREDLVVTGTPPATPYAGRLDLPFRESADGSEREAEEGSGAAGRALECDGEIYWGSGGDGWGKGEGGSTPEEGLNAYFDMEQPELPDHGYRIESEQETASCSRTTSEAGPRSPSSSPRTSRTAPVGARRRTPPVTPPNSPRATPTRSRTRSGPTAAATAWPPPC